MGIASSGRTPYGLTYGTRGTSNETSAQQTDVLHTRRDLSNLSSVFHVLDSSVYLDGDDLDVNIMVDPYELPPPETAEKLFNCYMQTAHSSSPVLPKVFEEQFRSYNDCVKRKRPSQVPKIWQAMFNLVLAIGAQYLQLIQTEWQAVAKQESELSTNMMEPTFH